MQRYLVERPEDVGDSGIYLRNAHYFIDVTFRNILDTTTKADPGAVNITITDPCGTVLVNSQAMSKITDGEYQYDYDIASSATYGRYTVQISTVTQTSLTQYDYYVLPWNAIPEVRRLSGIEQYKSISDEDLALMIWESFEETRRLVFEKHNDVKPKVDPDTGNWFDGTTTEFRTKHKYLADYDLDGSYTQPSSPCDIDVSGDIDGYWYDEDWERQDLTVTVNNSNNGKITLTQDDGVTAIPRSQNGVYLTYWTEFHTYSSHIFEKAVEYLAAHRAAKRFHEMDRASVFSMDENRVKYTADPDRLKKIFKEQIGLIRRPMCDGVK